MTAEWSGLPELEGHLVLTDSLIVLPGNPRQGDVGAISESLRRFGQQKPIVVDSDGVILAGNHTYLAARALGWEKVAAVVSDLEGQDKTGFALADNRLSDLADYDDELLMAAMASLDDLTGTGYDGEDMEELRYKLDEPLSFQEFLGDPARLDEVKGGGLIGCPECGAEFAWSDRVKPVLSG